METTDIEGLKAGDEAAFERLIRENATELLTYLHVLGAEDAEDAVSSAFVHVFRNRNALEHIENQAQLRAYLFSLVRRHAFAYRRDQQRRERIAKQYRETLDALEEVYHVPETVPPELEPKLNERLQEALRTLPEGERRIIELRYLEGRPYTEVAAILGRTPGSLRVSSARALRRLREILAPTIAEAEHG